MAKQRADGSTSVSKVPCGPAANSTRSTRDDDDDDVDDEMITSRGQARW
jgi:hypothetical protein